MSWWDLKYIPVLVCIALAVWCAAAAMIKTPGENHAGILIVPAALFFLMAWACYLVALVL